VLGTYLKPQYTDAVMRKYGFRDWDSVLAAIGHGGLREGQVLNKLIDVYNQEHASEITDEEVMESVAENKAKTERHRSAGGILVHGIDDVAVRFSRCCSPIPGDEIVGFVTRGRGISIHRTDCVNVITLSESERHRLIEAEWSADARKQKDRLYTTEIRIFANNRTGILVDVTKVFTEAQIEMDSVSARNSKQGTATIDVVFEINGMVQLNSLMSKIRNIESVIDIERTSG